MIWQVIIAAMLSGALFTGRPSLRFSVVMIANFVATVTISLTPDSPENAGATYLAIGIADVACIAALVGINTRANVVAIIFALMLPVYVSGYLFKWTPWTTYAIVDLLAYVQFAVVGKWDGGIGKLVNLLRPKAVAVLDPHRGSGIRSRMGAQKGLHSRIRD